MIGHEENGSHREVPVRELRAGDLLFARDSSSISIWIRRLDGGRYSHVGLWDGTSVLEASGDGGRVRTRDVETFVSEHEETAVRRLARDGSTLGDPGWSADPVIEIARSYLGATYPYAELCLIGVLVALGRATGHPSVQEFVRTLAPELARFLCSEPAGSRAGPAMTCSQFASLCFWEADPSVNRRYALVVEYPSSRPWRAAAESDLSLEERRAFLALLRACRARFPGRPQALRPRYRDLARGLRGERALGVKSMPLRAGDTSLPAGCVTPRDLEESSSLIHVGEVVL